ncbi:PilZ domain-containing protein [Tardiphaga alba]|uniref:PilZ domain-containing protein n=1 Tax=Tardiphaga alba TaxID=340268 RepID=A0ABX8A9S0_9BRAD|nr:PilZ domain-containing protein [Tardiphaga alba]QUS39409.1 PilZ domain-containing protein [Tardiphaga alba]
MADDIASGGRVTFGRGYNVWIMGIDGTWRRNCVLTAVSMHDAELTLESSIEGLNLKEFFLLLSSTGLAYRRCELVKVNGAQIDIRFLNTKGTTKKKSSTRDDSDMVSA